MINDTQAKKKRIAVWWIFPCKATSGIFRELSEKDIEIDVYLFQGLSENRLKLGWYMPDYGKAKVTILPQDEKERTRALSAINYENYDLHLLNAFYGTWGIMEVADTLQRLNLPYGVLTEAPFNAFHGLKRLAKYIYLITVVPFVGGRIARHARFVCSLSGTSKKNQRWFHWFGFQEDNIFPFGYFSEEPPIVKTRIEQNANPPMLVCTGYLTPGKGQFMLLQALVSLKNKGINFLCKITGYGPEKEKLERFISENGMGEQVRLVGVVSKEELWQLQAEADIFVAPGYEEPWGIRINEALQSGCPVVLSDRIGAAELVLASGGGKTFSAGSKESLAQVLEELLAHPEKLIEMKRRVATYRKNIHPRAAAQYLNSVISHSLDGAPRPKLPDWLLEERKI